MPQPLSKVKPNVGFQLGNSSDNPSDHRPELALLGMKVISSWSILESFLSGAFVKMLGANPRPAAAIFSALSSTASQKAALRAVARISLSERDNELFEEILRHFTIAAKSRNKIAHWVWGHCDHLPDAVLLCHPQTLIDITISFDGWSSELRAQNFKTLTEPPAIPDSEIFVYRAVDFERSIKEIQRVTEFVAMFRNMLVNVAHDHVYDSLLSAPEFQSLRDRLLERQKTAQAAPQQPPP